MRIEHVLVPNQKQAIIKIEGLIRPLSLLHVTDCHMNETDLKDGEEAFAESMRLYGFDALATRNHFDDALRYANDKSFDCVALTGDVVNGATIGNLEHLEGRLERLAMPYLYTPGNHDWEYPHQSWGERTRAVQYPKFARITGGQPAYRAIALQGVNLVAIDNSTYQITEEQLAFFRERLAEGLPTLLFSHIPIYVPSLLPEVVKIWGSPIMMAAEGWDEKLRKEWMVEKTTAATRAFYELLLNNPYDNFVGVFCGHVHFGHASPFGRGSCQYVTEPGFAGGYRVIHLLPATSP